MILGSMVEIIIFLIQFMKIVLVFSLMNFVDFEKLLKTCQKLKVLSIFMTHIDEENEFKSDEEKLLKYGENFQKH